MATARQNTKIKIRSYKVVLDDGAMTTIYVARYAKTSTKPRVVLFQKETRLLDWCKQNNVHNAVVGGFFLRGQHKALGDLWLQGVKQKTEPVIKPWDKTRGSLYINGRSQLTLAPRNLLPAQPAGDLLQAGPLLISGSKPTIRGEEDIEGISAGASQFDSDISLGRYPRAAIATDSKYIYTVACDGRTQDEAGLTFKEFTEVLLKIGAKEALNLDSGSSATLIAEGNLLNRSRGGKKDDFALFPKGRPVYSAIVFD